MERKFEEDKARVLKHIDLGMCSFNNMNEVDNVFHAGINVGICINEIEKAREILESQSCPHPYHEVESYHDGAMLCNACNYVIEQNGEKIDPPSKLC